MKRRFVLYCLSLASAFVFSTWTSSSTSAAVLTTVSFQNGAGGYTGAFDRRIGPGASQVNGSAVDTDTTSYFIDGGASALNDAGFSQGLIRFDNIVGGGGIPAGAKIVSADLEARTTASTVSANSQSNGAYNVYELNTAFDGSTAHDDAAFAVGRNGVSGNVFQITGSFDGMTTADSIVNARVDRAVQKWVNGGTNFGLAIASDRNTDGWSVNTTGAATIANSPKLNVTYTTDPSVVIDRYSPSADSFPNGISGATVGTIVNGTSIAEGFVDGDNGTDSFDQPYLVKFGSVNLNFSQILKAELVFVSGFSSASADSPEPWTIHRMLKDWDSATTYASFDSDSNPALNNSSELVDNGTIARATLTLPNVNDTEMVHLDVTSIVEAWRTGAPNFGIYVGAVSGTTNGWQIFTSGAVDPSFRPELRIVGIAVPEPSTLVLLSILGLFKFVRSRRQMFVGVQQPV